MSRPEYLLGIDPGDRWVGVSVLYIPKSEKWLHMRSAVFDANAYTFVGLIDTIMTFFNDLGKTKVLTEEYRQRPVGHQRFKDSQTSRMIGAIQYVAEREGLGWTPYPAGDPDKELPRLVLGDYIELWRIHWPKPNDPRWHHARSAWRLIARHMFLYDTQFLKLLRSSAVPDPELLSQGVDDGAQIVAPYARWSTGQ